MKDSSLVRAAEVGRDGRASAMVSAGNTGATMASALLRMGAIAACPVGAPISTVILIFELTGDYGVTFAVMIAVAVASVFFRQLHGYSYFTWRDTKAELTDVLDALASRARAT